MTNRVLVEIAVDSVTGAQAAANGGADRIELCADLAAGGLTPSLGLLETVKRTVELPVHAMLRPRAGNFLYDDGEWQTILADLEALAAAGADGFVFGSLHPDGTIDEGRTRALCQAAGPLPRTFHRAFDHSADAAAALETLIDLGIERVLTSGQQRTAPRGKACLAGLVEQARDRIVVMAGAGIRDDNVVDLVQQTRIPEVHLSAGASRPGGMQHWPADVPMGRDDEPDDQVRVTDEAMVSRVVKALRAQG
ncbi:MAG: copper homeostasis protein CutC [Planctomycetota bacterium]|nr:copper homeostasis protein CutC [Planctomycetota bacterium]